MRVSITPVDINDIIDGSRKMSDDAVSNARGGYDLENKSLQKASSVVQRGSIASIVNENSRGFDRGVSGDSIQFNMLSPRALKTPKNMWKVSMGQKLQTSSSMIRFLTPEICCTLSRNALNSLARDVTIPFSYRLIRRNKFNEVMGDFKCKSRDNFKGYDIVMNEKEVLTQVFTHPRYIRHSRSSQFIGDGFHCDKHLRFIEKTSKVISSGILSLSEIRR